MTTRCQDATKQAQEKLLFKRKENRALKEAVTYTAYVPNYRAGYEADNGGDDGGGVKECKQCGGEQSCSKPVTKIVQQHQTSNNNLQPAMAQFRGERGGGRRHN